MLTNRNLGGDKPLKPCSVPASTLPLGRHLQRELDLRFRKAGWAERRKRTKSRVRPSVALREKGWSLSSHLGKGFN